MPYWKSSLYEAFKVCIFIIGLGPPDPPYNISFTSDTDIITVSWRPGFHGGADQTFHLQLLTSDQLVKESLDTDGGQLEDTTFNTTFKDLTPGSVFFINISSRNEFGSTLGPFHVTVQTKQGMYREYLIKQLMYHV